MCTAHYRDHYHPCYTTFQLPSLSLTVMAVLITVVATLPHCHCHCLPDTKTWWGHNRKHSSSESLLTCWHPPNPLSPPFPSWPIPILLASTPVAPLYHPVSTQSHLTYTHLTSFMMLTTSRAQPAIPVHIVLMLPMSPVTTANHQLEQPPWLPSTLPGKYLPSNPHWCCSVLNGRPKNMSAGQVRHVWLALLALKSQNNGMEDGGDVIMGQKIGKTW